MKNKRQLIFRIAARQEYKAYHKVKVIVDGKEVAKLSERDRGMADIMGQTLTMTLEITDEKDAAPHSHKVSMGVPYNMDGIIINIPALMAGQPEEAYMSEFVIVAPEEDEEEEINTDEFDMGEEMGDI